MLKTILCKIILCKKTQCEDCLKFFKKKNIEELVLSGEKLCKECYKRRTSHQLEDPNPLP